MSVPRTPEQTREDEVHVQLRAVIRSASLAQADRLVAEGKDEDSRADVERGMLVDYVVVAVFDSGDEDSNVMITIRTDGKCSRHRVVGMLGTALNDL